MLDTWLSLAPDEASTVLDANTYGRAIAHGEAIARGAY